MKLEDFKKCAICGKGVLHNRIPLFYRVKIQRFGIDMRAVKEQSVLEMMIGGPLAQVMGPNRDFTDPITKEIEVFICESCSSEATCIALLAEEK